MSEQFPEGTRVRITADDGLGNTLYAEGTVVPSVWTATDPRRTVAVSIDLGTMEANNPEDYIDAQFMPGLFLPSELEVIE